jgi:flagellin-like hook-associated protein FlgL
MVNAIVTFSGADGGVSPVATLEGVSRSAKSVSLGGISFTVNQATTLDVGLTAYLKAYTYVSATTRDNALEFQVGPDEGMTHKVGIQKMDVRTLFRAGVAEYDYENVGLETTLKAQDLIGQIDDALNFVGSENLHVGQFQNQMTRTLDLARQQQTSITGAYSNINDADMAKEATNQSKRMVLVQSATAMVAQANSQGQFILQLLR